VWEKDGEGAQRRKKKKFSGELKEAPKEKRGGENKGKKNLKRGAREIRERS